MISFILTLKRLLSGLFHAFKNKDFIALFVLILLVLLSGTLFYTKEEGLSVIDALYFCVMTLSTIGDPSFVPQTAFGKIFTMIYVVAGTGLFIALIITVARSILNSKKKDKEDEKEDESKKENGSSKAKK